MFLQPDDHMIVQDSNAFAVWWNEVRDLRVDELKRLNQECGVKTAHVMCHWNRVETAGEYDWTLIDEVVNRFRAGGMKMLMQIPVSPPQDLENLDWYGQGRDGEPYRGLLSFWNMEARQYTENFIKDAIAHYDSNDINFIHAGLISEHYLWNAPVYLDTAAAQRFQWKYDDDIQNHIGGITTVTRQLREFLRDGVIDHYLAMQRTLVGQHNEIWDHTQWVIALQSEHNGSFARPDLYAAYQREFPDAQRMMMASTYFSHGEGNAHVVNDLLRMYDAKVIVEAQYPAGLRVDPGNGKSTTDWAIAGGLLPDYGNPERWIGQCVSLFNTFGDTEGFEELPDWKFEVVKAANDKWAAAKAGRCS